MFIRKTVFLFVPVLLTIIGLALLSSPKHEVSLTLDPVLILDPGHGGADGGAVAADGTEEAGINLDIAQRSAALAVLFGIEYEMTRSSAELDYPDEANTVAKMKIADQHRRMTLINSTPGAVLISIHQNYYPSSAPFGPQVFFGSNEDSIALASVAQDNLTTQLVPENRRLAAPVSENVYLLHNAYCPAILIECGFLSNETELNQLKTEEYRRKLSVIVIASYLQYMRGLIT